MTYAEKAVRGLLVFNFVLHIISAAFAGAWVAELLAPFGALSSLDWVKLGLSVVALALGLTGSSYIALRYITVLPEPLQRRAKVAFIIVYTVIAVVLAAASASVIAQSAGDRTHMERVLDRYREALEARRAAAAQILSRTTALNDCVTVGSAMSGEEANSGAFSEEGRNVGRVAITLRNVSTGCEVALRHIYHSRDAISRRIERAEHLLIEIRQIIDGDADEARKLVLVQKKMDELSRVLRAINDAFPVAAIEAAAAATSKDWHGMGLPESAASALTANFAGLAERVTEGLDDIADLQARELPQMRVVPAMAYLALYPEATAGALVLGLLIELLPLVTILIGFALAEHAQREATIAGGELEALEVSGADTTPPAQRKRGRPRKAQSGRLVRAANGHDTGRSPRLS
jgi:hypothetical protein